MKCNLCKLDKDKINVFHTISYRTTKLIDGVKHKLYKHVNICDDCLYKIKTGVELK